MSHLDEGTIHAWLDGALSDDESRAVEAHVAGCAECSAAMAEARGLVAAASRILTTLDDVPAGVIPQPAAPPTRATAVAKPRRWSSPRMAAAAALMFVAVGTYAVSRDQGAPASSSTELVTGEPASVTVAAPEAPAAIADSVASRPAPRDRAQDASSDASILAPTEAAPSAPANAAGPPSRSDEQSRQARALSHPSVRATPPSPAPPIEAAARKAPTTAAETADRSSNRFQQRDAAPAAPAPSSATVPVAPVAPSPNAQRLTPRRMGGMAGARPRELEAQATGAPLRLRQDEKTRDEIASAREKRSAEARTRQDSLNLESVVVTGSTALARAASGRAATPSRTDDAALLVRFAGCYRLSALSVPADAAAPSIPAQIALDTMRVNPTASEPPLYRVRLLPPVVASDYDEVTWAPDTSAAGFELYWRSGVAERGVVFAERPGAFTGALREWPMLSLRASLVTVTAREARCGSR